MADKIITKVVPKTEYHHSFYCDNCNKLLGESVEHEDGWYEEFGDYKESIRISGEGEFIKKGYLCDACRKEFTFSLVNALHNLGFELRT